MVDMKWIRVKDQPPPQGKKVLIWDSEGEEYGFGYLMGNVFVDLVSGHLLDSWVTHWFKPEPPKE